MRTPRIDWTEAAWVSACGAFIGITAPLLTAWGNPVDGGVSVACFGRDIAGALGFHRFIEFSYLRPAFIGMVLGAFGSSLAGRDFRTVGGSSPLLRFAAGVLVSCAIFVFVGCPLRLGLRLAGGDPAAIPALIGLVGGTALGTTMLKRGFDLGRSGPIPLVNGLLLPAAMVILLLVLVTDSVPTMMSAQRHAPASISLLAGAGIGVLAQRTKFCTISGIRNSFLIGDFTLLTGFVAMVAAALGTNAVVGQLHVGTHIIGSADPLWNVLSMACAGMGLTLLGGCPLRQLVLASQGNADNALVVCGLITGAALAYNWNIAYTAGSIDPVGKVVVAAALAFFGGLGFFTGGKA